MLIGATNYSEVLQRLYIEYSTGKKYCSVCSGSLFETNKRYKKMTVYPSPYYTKHYIIGYYEDGTYDLIANGDAAGENNTYVYDISAYSVITMACIATWSGTGLREAVVEFSV